LCAIMDALTAHSTMSKQSLESEKVRSGLKDVLLGAAQLYEALRLGEKLRRWWIIGKVVGPALPADGQIRRSLAMRQV
jgi:hypothetical protein